MLSFLLPLILLAEDRIVSPTPRTTRPKPAVGSGTSLETPTKSAGVIGVAAKKKSGMKVAHDQIPSENNRPFWDVNSCAAAESGLNAPQLAAHKVMTLLFRSVAIVPKARLHFWSWLRKNWPNETIIGWHGMVESITEVEGGGLVQLTAAPSLKSNSLHLILFGYSEVYFVDAANNITYKGSKDLPGNAGKMPGIISY